MRVMEKFIDVKRGFPTHVFEIVNKWPWGGYTVWNIGRENFQHPGYIPLAQEGSLPYHINQKTLKALYVGDEDLCLRVLRYASQHGCDEKKFAELALDYFASL